MQSHTPEPDAGKIPTARRLCNGSRRKRIARGSGTNVQEVNHLLRQYAQMRKMFKQIGKGSFARRLAGMKLPGM